MEQYTYHLHQHWTGKEKEINYKDLPKELRDWLKARSKRKTENKRFIDQLCQYAGKGWYYIIRRIKETVYEETTR